MKFNILILCIAVGFLASCSSSPEEDKWKEVMAIHDEVMPKISDINKTVKAFKNIRENETDTFNQYREQILINLQNLESAEEKMFTWMNELQRLPDLKKTMSQEEILEYLDGEKQKITDVKDAMLSSISDSQALLAKMKD